MSGNRKHPEFGNSITYIGEYMLFIARHGNCLIVENSGASSITKGPDRHDGVLGHGGKRVSGSCIGWKIWKSDVGGGNGVHRGSIG